MTIMTTGLVSSFGSAGATSGALVGALTGLTVGGFTKLVSTGTASSALAGAAGASASAGTILGAAWCAEVASAVAGGVFGAASSALTVSALSAEALLSGPVGWLVLGMEKEEQALAGYSFDCWKPVLRENSFEPSMGRFLRDVAGDARIKGVMSTYDGDSLPEIVLQNIWDERFRIDYVMLPYGQRAAHAVLLE